MAEYHWGFYPGTSTFTTTGADYYYLVLCCLTGTVQHWKEHWKSVLTCISHSTLRNSFRKIREIPSFRDMRSVGNYNVIMACGNTWNFLCASSVGLMQLLKDIFSCCPLLDEQVPQFRNTHHTLSLSQCPLLAMDQHLLNSSISRCSWKTASSSAAISTRASALTEERSVTSGCREN